MAKLLIVGDSFAAEPPKGDDFKPWFRQAGELLDLEVENYAMIGVSQDWCFWNWYRARRIGSKATLQRNSI